MYIYFRPPIERPVGTATIIYRELKPPELKGTETWEELTHWRNVAVKVTEEFSENNLEIEIRTPGRIFG
jgi:hypothetical protein